MRKFNMEEGLVLTEAQDKNLVSAVLVNKKMKLTFTQR